MAAAIAAIVSTVLTIQQATSQIPDEIPVVAAIEPCRE